MKFIRKARIVFFFSVLALFLVVRSCETESISAKKPGNTLPTPAVTKFIPPPTPRPLLPAELVSFELSEAMFAPATEQGTVIDVEYQTYDYRFTELEPVTKNLSVYLPYGYDEAKQYDVVFLMHVSGRDENYWFNSNMYYASYEKGYIYINVKDMVDNMIEQGRCKPCILVSVDGFLYDEQRQLHNTAPAYAQFSPELGNDIMPCIIRNFSTYAGGTSREEIAAAREHFGFMGASYGAYMGHISVMRDNFDLVANYAISGGGRMNYELIEQAWNKNGTAELYMECLYIGVGALDDRAGPEGSYLEFAKHSEKFNSENLYFSLYTQTAHEPREWINSLYNALQLFFR